MAVKPKGTFGGPADGVHTKSARKGTPPKKGGALPAKVAKPVKGKNRKGSR
jgi:hypothetical protein